MRSKLMVPLLVLFALVMLVACGNGSQSCGNDNDCVGTERCLWLKQNGQVIGKRCTLLCSFSEECPEGEKCNNDAITCPSCTDYRRVCNGGQ